MSAGRPLFPFSAIVGQEALKLALVLNAVDPSIGGALIRGDKGTAKSTAVRALAALLPPLAVVEGCPFRCAPEDPPAACPWCAEHGGAARPDSASDATAGTSVVSPVVGSSGGPANGAARPWVMRPVSLVELPVSATEDRVAGSFSLEAAIQRGLRRFEPGLLATANRGILYIDEVNLLPDHLVDVVLDASAGGIHRVEREGVSFVHAARFVLVGTMNPEEGELRPQLLDRFGLAAEVTTPRDPLDRAAVVRRRIAFDADPVQFTARWAAADGALGAQITAARDRLPAVQIDDALLRLITRICVAYDVDGLRADIVIYKASAALAALDRRDRATAADVRRAAELALPHRRRRDPFDEAGFDPSALDRLTGDHPAADVPSSAGPGDSDHGRTDEGQLDGAGPLTTEAAAAEARSAPAFEAPAAPGRAAQNDGGSAPAGDPLSGSTAPRGAQRNGADEPVAPVLPQGALPEPTPSGAARPSAPARRRAGRGTPGALDGHDAGSARPRGRPTSLALGATLRAAAPHQLHRQGPVMPGAAVPLAVRLLPSDFRERVHEAHQGRLLLFVVDASGSMAGQRRLALAKGAVRALLLDAYRRRDTVGLIAFRGAQARLVLPPTNSVSLADRRLADLRPGGRTPLAAALILAQKTVHRHAHGAAPLLIVVTDGKANVAGAGRDPWTEALGAAGHLRRQGIAAAVVDADWGSTHLGLSQALADALGGAVLRLLPGPDTAAPIPAGSLVGAVQRLLPPSGAKRGTRWV